MRIPPVLPLVALAATLPLAVGCASSPAPLEVMTFNVRYANPQDGADAWEQRTDLVFGVIRRRAPDLIGLQEALPEQMDELRAAFPGYRFLGQGREGGNRGEHSALMVRDERLEVVESGDFWLSPTPDEVGSRGWDAALPRMCTWAILRDRTLGTALLAMNTHFDHRGSEARRKSARVILERSARHADLPLVLTGDLNAGEASPPLVELRAGGLRDTYREVHPDAVTAGTFNGFRGVSGGAKIDYVLVDDGWTTLSAAIVRDHDGGRYPSDHYPVVATIVPRQDPSRRTSEAGEARSGASRPVHDLVIYGGTSAGVIAAVQARAMEKSVVLVCPERHVGGLSASGLGWTDSGDKAVIGGLAREFYRRVKAHYDDPAAWRQQHPDDDSRYRPEADAMWVFEPHVAEGVFEDLLRELDVQVHREARLDREHGVVMNGTAIASITTLDGATHAGRTFIDATYEGDLMAAAGVSYVVGRESSATYGESLNGVQTKNARSHQFTNRVSPYVVPDDPESGLLPRVHPGPPGEEGAGDNRVQAYNYRLCLTDEPSNRLPFERPPGYDALQYELLLRDLLAGSRHVFGKFDPVPNAKTDTNNHGSFSTDNIGMNYDYPEASYERRQEILEEHQRYQKGYFWFLCNDPRVPADVRERMSRWGLAADEFTDNGGWPHQIYVREARRMVGEFVMTERCLRGLDPTPRPVGMGSYNMDSHHVQRYVAHDEEGRAYVLNEGDIQVSPGRSYPIALGALFPRREECTNLVVPVAVSASHIAYGSIRMEPVFMILGQSAATVAALAVEGNSAVQDVSWPELRARLVADGQVLE